MPSSIHELRKDIATKNEERNRNFTTSMKRKIPNHRSVTIKVQRIFLLNENDL